MVNYLTAKQVTLMNVFQIETYSPGEMVGVRDIAALDMAINQPKQFVFGEEIYSTIEEKAAILAINLVKKHPFHNANKRTAIMALDIFLQMNGGEIELTTEEGLKLVLNIATYQGNDFEKLKNEVTRLIESSTNS